MRLPRCLNSGSCELALIATALAYFAFSPRLVDVPLCPSAFFASTPCPTCGTTRAVWHVLHGRFLAAWELNPIGFLVVFILIRRIIVLSFEDRAATRWLEKETLNLALLSAFLLFGFLKGFLPLLG